MGQPLLVVKGNVCIENLEVELKYIRIQTKTVANICDKQFYSQNDEKEIEEILQ